MSNTIIALTGKNMGALFVGIREIPTKKVVLIAQKGEKNLTHIQKDLERFKIPLELELVEEVTFETVFETIAKAKRRQEEPPIINVSTSDGMGPCISLSASFVNGLKAFYVMDDQVNFFPVLKFSYYNLLQEKKQEILKTLDKDPMCCNSLEELSQRTKTSLPLISYHVNGNKSSQGLVEMGLVTTSKEDGKIQVKLTVLGKLLVRGCI